MSSEPSARLVVERCTPLSMFFARISAPVTALPEAVIVPRIVPVVVWAEAPRAPTMRNPSPTSAPLRHRTSVVFIIPTSSRGVSLRTACATGAPNDQRRGDRLAGRVPVGPRGPRAEQPGHRPLAELGDVHVDGRQS